MGTKTLKELTLKVIWNTFDIVCLKDGEYCISSKLSILLQVDMANSSFAQSWDKTRKLF